MRANRGSSLATTLLACTFILIVGMALANGSLAHLQFARSHSRGRKAKAAAEAVLALAIERCLKRPEFGKQSLESDSLEIDLGDSTRARLTFSPGKAGDWKIPHSTNHQATTSEGTGWNQRVLPANSLHLVGSGQSQGISRRIEMLLSVPEFPYALAAAGPIHSRGSLLVGGVDKLEDALPEVNRERLLPADLASNAQGEAVVLEGKATVTGDLQSVGSIRLGPEVVLRGVLREGADPVKLHTLDVGRLRPEGSLPLHPTGSSVAVEGSQHYLDSALTIPGDLNLKDGVLFVNGDLTVRGAVKGRGALLVNGKASLLDGAALSADDQLALVARDDVIIQGGGQQNSFFQGLVYTEGDLRVADVTVLGTLVANRPASPVDPGSRMEVERTTLVHVPSHSHYESQRRVLTFAPDRYERDDEMNDMYDMEVTEDQLKAVQQQLDFEAENPERFNSSPSQVETLARLLREMRVRPTEGSTFTFPAPVSGGHENDTVDPYTALATSLLRSGWTTRGSEGPPSFQLLKPAFQFDLNEFLDPSSRTRVILWREL